MMTILIRTAYFATGYLQRGIKSLPYSVEDRFILQYCL